ncbi:DUF86 domain-containing protein [Flavobacterium sp.]|uniref:HepT-like ribonuclease domain-containing protein n=1 Tax=Flavobacterium sp. TaxID=239 RepID=UPI003527C6F1
MQNNFKDKIRLQHIFDAISEIETYNLSKNFDDFTEDSMLQNASIRLLEVIGEASNHLSKEIIEKYNTIEWAQIIGLRNFLIHEYFGVDLHIVWNIIRYELPDFKNQIQLIIEDLEIK